MFANQLLPSLHEKPFGLRGSSTVNRMHECEMARTSQSSELVSRFDALTNDVILAIRRTPSAGGRCRTAPRSGPNPRWDIQTGARRRFRGGARPDPFAEGHASMHSDAMFVVVDLRGPPRLEAGCRLRFAQCVQRAIREIGCSGSQAAGGVRRSASTSAGRCGCCLGSPCWRRWSPALCSRWFPCRAMG